MERVASVRTSYVDGTAGPHCYRRQHVGEPSILTGSVVQTATKEVAWCAEQLPLMSTDISIM